MPAPSSWMMPGNGILSGLMLNAEGPPAIGDDPLWAQAAREAWQRQLQAGANRPRYVSSNPAPQASLSGPALGAIPWSPAVLNGGFDLGGPPWPPPSGGRLPNASLMSIPQSVPMSDGDEASQIGTAPTRASARPTVTPTPVSYDDPTRPSWIGPPIPGPFSDWEREYTKGMYGLYRFLRSFGGRGTSSRGSGDENENEDYCYNRWEKEDARCGQFLPFGVRYYRACKDRASARRDLCIRNGGRPDPNEPDEYDWRDIPRDAPGSRSRS